MLAVGSVVAGAGVLVASLLALLFRHPEAPRWTRPEVVVMVVSVAVAGVIGFGLGHVLAGLYALLQGRGDARELAALVAVPAAVGPCLVCAQDRRTPAPVCRGGSGRTLEPVAGDRSPARGHGR